MGVLLAAVSLQLLAGALALIFSKSPRTASALGAGGAVLGCLGALAPALRVFLSGVSESLRLEWGPAHGPFVIEIDLLSAFFLLPVLGLSGLAAVYGAGYLDAVRNAKSLGAAWLFFNAFVAGMTLVLAARTVVLFLIAWEVMSISAFMLVTFEHEQAETRRAGWVYLIAAHLGVVFLVFAFVLLGRSAGSLEFSAFHDITDRAAGWSGAIFVLALIGFGAKAGFTPFHVWLPEAHAAAPSHVSALMSGVMIKIGVYGILRVLTFLNNPAAWWGLTLAAVGLLTALIGIAMALLQRDIKRVLAYSSVENIGLIGLALGVGVWGWATHRPAAAVLGMTAAFLHVWNHALMKGLMFFAAGSVVHGAGTRDMEKLGGLMKRMPVTGALMTLGAVSIAALPPMNGFVGKWLIYMSLLQSSFAAGGNRRIAALFAIGLLALVGGLAALTFVRLIGIVLLGSPRSEAAGHAHESSTWLLAPMLLLASLCIVAAVIPQAIAGLLLGVLDQVLGPEAGAAFLKLEANDAPLGTIGDVNAWTFAACGGVAVLLARLSRKRLRTTAPTWGCGYLAPTARMQYTGKSFAEVIGEQLLPRFLRPRTTKHAPRGPFPTEGELHSESPDPVGAKIYEPFFRYCADRFARFRVLQQGMVHVYLVYVALVVVLALAWVSLRD
jgi:hydrogenase-4 component B